MAEQIWYLLSKVIKVSNGNKGTGHDPDSGGSPSQITYHEHLGEAKDFGELMYGQNGYTIKPIYKSAIPRRL